MRLRQLGDNDTTTTTTNTTAAAVFAPTPPLLDPVGQRLAAIPLQEIF